MSVQSDIFIGLAEVYEHGARKSRLWSFNIDRQQEADVLEAMATKAREIAGRHAD